MLALNANIMVDYLPEPKPPSENKDVQRLKPSMGLKSVKLGRNGQRAWHVFMNSRLWDERLGLSLVKKPGTKVKGI